MRYVSTVAPGKELNLVGQNAPKCAENKAKVRALKMVLGPAGRSTKVLRGMFSERNSKCNQQQTHTCKRMYED